MNALRRFRQGVLTLAILLVAVQAWAQNWIGNAAAVKQISTIAVANTWATGDTGTVTINTKPLTITVGTEATTADVASAIAAAWNATTRLDGSGSPDASSNVGGSEFGEFAEVTASASGSVVTLVGDTAGKPFTFASSYVTAGTGTLADATTQPATGPNFWDNADNWDTGSVPVNDGTVTFRDSNVPCKYGVPQGSLEVTVHVYKSFSGTIGLPDVNTDNQSLPYQEYRDRFVELDDSGTGTNIAHRFGIGDDGTGCTLCRIKHTGVKCSPLVFATGTSQISGTKALNICCTDNTSTINILEGSVDYSSQDGGTSAFLYVTQTGGDSRGISAIATASATVDVRGGKMLIGGTGAINAINVGAGTLRLEDQTGTITSLIVSAGGTIDIASAATITTLTVNNGGTFDARSGAGSFTITNTLVYEGGAFLDPYRRIAIGSNFTVYFEPSASLQFGATPSTQINISKP